MVQRYYTSIGYSRCVPSKKTFLINIVDKADPVYTANDVAEYKKERPQGDVPFSVGDPKVQIYACPVTVMDFIFGIVHNAGENIAHYSEGRDIRIKKIPNKNRILTQYQVYPELKVTPAGVSEDLELPNLADVGFTLDYDGLVGLLESGRAADFAGALPGGSSNSLPASTEGSAEEVAAQPEVSADDLAEQMRQQLANG